MGFVGSTEKGVLARALYTNRPEAKNELFFRKGDILTVIEHDHDGQPGWWLCALRGQRGICPSNYLEVLEDKYSVPAKNNLSTTDSKSCIQLQPKLKDESSLGKEGKKDELDSIVNPLETYDFPRSVGDIDLSVNIGNKSNSKNVHVDKGKSRSCAALLTHSHDHDGSGRGSSSLSIGASVSPSTSSTASSISLQQQREREPEHTYSNEEPLYENDCVSLPQQKDSSSSLSISIPTSEANPLDLYDVPRSSLPFFGQSITRLRKYGSCSDDINTGNSLKLVAETTSSSSGGAGRLSTATLGRNLRGRKTTLTTNTTPLSSSVSPPNLPQSPPPPSPPSPSSYPPVQLRRPHRQPHFSGHQSSSQPQFSFVHSNRSSSAESGIVMVSSSSATTSSLNQMQTDGENSLYDVPRGSGAPISNPSSVANLVNAFNSKGHSTISNNPASGTSRPSSALSITSSGMGLSIATSDSKDSLDGLYDVPRTAIKAYVNHMETKYDELARHRNDSCSSLNSSVSSQIQIQNSPQHHNHSRHNSTSSIFSAYGYTRNGGRGSVSGASLNGGGGGEITTSGSTSTSTSTLGRTHNNYQQQQQRYQSQAQSVDELYDVPRGTLDHPIAQARMLPPPPPSRKPMMGSIAKSNGSLNHDGGGDDDPMQFYDVPREFQRKTSMGTIENNQNNHHLNVVSRGISSSSLSSSSISGSSFTSANNVANSGNRPRSGSVNNGGVVSRNKCDSADVKILPLCPKAAVSVCEKLRQEVVSSIGSILAHVKPKWRSKENLQEIMPDLKFSCTRLCLAIKDIADFASRSLSNAKRLPDDSSSSISVRLHRLLTPVINGSQIIQRDVDELEAYFWSIDRLSISNGDSSNSSSNHMNGSGDALDQLILCSRSLKHDVTELANFLALHSTALYKEVERQSLVQNQPTTSSPKAPGAGGVSKTKEVIQSQPETRVDDTQEDYDYVSLIPTQTQTQTGFTGSTDSNDDDEVDSQKLSSTTSTVSWHLDSRDEQLLEFYSAQISVTAPQLSLSISTFISAIQQNEPPSVFNIHLKYVILLAYKLLFAGDTVHRNIGNQMLKEEVESKANDLHKSILALYEASKVATVEFPKIGPMQNIVDKVWGTTQAATQMKKVIFNAVYTAV